MVIITTATLMTLLKQLKPLCAAEGLVLTLSDEMVEVGGRVYVKSEAKLQDEI